MSFDEMDGMNYPQFRFNPQAEAYVPGPTPTAPMTSSSYQPMEPSVPVMNKVEMKNALKDRLRCALELIQRDPEEVQNVALSIRAEYEDANQYRNDMVHILLDEILALATGKDNFAYNGARLCCILSDFKEFIGHRTTDVDQEFFPFEDLLMDRLYAEFTYAKEATAAGNFQPRIHNFLIFFGTLITQKQMLVLIQRELLLFLRDLLNNQNYFKTVATVLKIGGSFFDSCEARWDLDSVMRRLLKIARNLPKDSLSHRQLYSLVELRAVGWDWDDPIKDFASMTMNKPVDNAIGAMGATSYEQIAPYNSMAFGFQPSEIDEFVREDEIDEEASEAYEQFLRQTGQLGNHQ